MNIKKWIVPITFIVIIGLISIFAWIHLRSQVDIEVNTVEVVSSTGKVHVISVEDLVLESFKGEHKRQVGPAIPRTFEGVSIKRLLTEICKIDIKDNNVVVVTSEDNYQVELTSQEVLMDNNVYLAIIMDDTQLENISKNGTAPMMVVLNDEFSNRWARYVKTITIKDVQ